MRNNNPRNRKYLPPRGYGYRAVEPREQAPSIGNGNSKKVRNESFDETFERVFERFAKWAVGFWIVGALLYIAFFVAVIWGIVALVLHFTG